MAKVRNPLAMKMRGRAGAYTFYTSEGRQIVRVAQNGSNYGDTARRTQKQQARRVLWANMVNFYKANKSWMRGAFEYKKPGQSDYNMFIKLNSSITRAALTKDQAEHGGCVVDHYRISDGSFPSLFVAYDSSAGSYTTRISSIRDFSNTDNTVAEFTQSILGANPGLREGMQLSFIQVWDSTRWQEILSVEVSTIELTLSLTDVRKLGVVLGEITLEHSESNNLVVAFGATTHCVAVVLSDSTGGQLHVSSESLVGGSVAEAVAMSQPAHVYQAMISYGLDESVFLHSGDMQPQPTT